MTSIVRDVPCILFFCFLDDSLDSQGGPSPPSGGGVDRAPPSRGAGPAMARGPAPSGAGSACALRTGLSPIDDYGDWVSGSGARFEEQASGNVYGHLSTVTR